MDAAKTATNVPRAAIKPEISGVRAKISLARTTR